MSSDSEHFKLLRQKCITFGCNKSCTFVTTIYSQTSSEKRRNSLDYIRISLYYAEDHQLCAHIVALFHDPSYGNELFAPPVYAAVNHSRRLSVT